MRSLIILEVEHGEDTDALDTLAMLACSLPEYSDGLEDIAVVNHTVRVDLPACFVLDSGSTNNNEGN